MKTIPLFLVACCLFNGGAALADGVSIDAGVDTCHPVPKADTPQYIIGYGSLMEETSRQRSIPEATEVVPVRVQGFRRAWIAKGTAIGLSTTFLGVTKNSRSAMNAILFPVDRDMARVDARENGYCRVPVTKSQIDTLDLSPVPDGEIWLYANKQQNMASPSAAYPIVQSYVDVFITGCLQIGEKFQLADFARECIGSTHGWSKQWVNDRIYPRRPFIYQPKSGEIDRLLNREIPAYFQAIRIE